MRARKTIALMGGVAGVCLLGTSALAQIETVVVTAEKRSQDLQKTPVAVTALQGNALDAMGITG